MQTWTGDNARPPGHRARWCRRLASTVACLCLIATPLRAQDWMDGLSSWSDPTSSWSPSPLTGWPGLGMPSGGPRLPMLPEAYRAAPDDWLPNMPGPPSAYPDRLGDAWRALPGRAANQTGFGRGDSFEPDLSGIWRGSGGEVVEIRRNRARIWGALDRPCSCVFFLVGQRLIAYSPDSDRVRKYWYQGGTDQFTLIDEDGNRMRFRRAR